MDSYLRPVQQIKMYLCREKCTTGVTKELAALQRNLAALFSAKECKRIRATDVALTFFDLK